MTRCNTWSMSSPGVAAGQLQAMGVAAGTSVPHPAQTSRLAPSVAGPRDGTSVRVTRPPGR